MLDICRGKHSGSRGHAGKGYVRAAVPALAAIAAAGLCLASPGTASAAESTAQPPAGAALAWGDNTYGELGNGTTTNSPVPVAVDLPAGTRATAIAAGYTQSLAVTSTGSVLAWGYNAHGELGDGTIGAPSATPVPVDLPAGTRVTAIADAGQGLAMTSTGSVLTWGYNYHGDLGDGSTANSSTPVPVDLPAGTSVVAIAAGGGGNSLAVAVHRSC